MSLAEGSGRESSSSSAPPFSGTTGVEGERLRTRETKSGLQTTASTAASATISASQPSGCRGSRGTYAAPAFNTDHTATTAPTSCGQSSATRPFAPVIRRRRRASASVVRSTSRYVSSREPSRTPIRSACVAAVVLNRLTSVSSTLASAGATYPADMGSDHPAARAGRSSRRMAPTGLPGACTVPVMMETTSSGKMHARAGSMAVASNSTRISVCPLAAAVTSRTAQPPPRQRAARGPRPSMPTAHNTEPSGGRSTAMSRATAGGGPVPSSGGAPR